MDNKWYLYNVVFYDGVDAFVSKFVASADETDARKHIVSYTAGNGEVLKLDKLYPLSFEDIIAMKNVSDDYMEKVTDAREKKNAVERWIVMYF